jgi:hypothetical protein
MGGMPSDTAGFDTAIVTETTQSENQDITNVGGALQLYESPSLSIYSVQQEFHVACALWVSKPGDTVLFATATVPEVHKPDEAKIADVGDVLQLSGCTIPAFV